jgi:glucan 1,3-beta-glucosidase
MSQIRAVNLGGWLVLERWIRESLFEGVNGYDETQFCLQVPDKAAKLEAHRSTFITEEDFKWIADHGLNTVRLPYPYWVFGDVEPYVGCIHWVDQVMAWAEKYHLQVLLDLHTAPGCQNGFDNGGQLGVLTWHTDPKNLDQTIDVLVKVAQRYKHHKALWGMQVLNEPHWTLPIPFIEAFYKQRRLSSTMPSAIPPGNPS